MNFTVSHHGNRSSTEFCVGCPFNQNEIQTAQTDVKVSSLSAKLRNPFDYNLHNANWTTITHRFLWARKISYTIQPKETNSNENTTIKNHKNMWQVALYTCDLFVFFFPSNVNYNWQLLARTSHRFTWDFVWMNLHSLAQIIGCFDSNLKKIINFGVDIWDLFLIWLKLSTFKHSLFRNWFVVLTWRCDNHDVVIN